MRLLADNFASSGVYALTSYFFDKLVEPEGRNSFSYEAVRGWAVRVSWAPSVPTLEFQGLTRTLEHKHLI